jgi:hypothetical protein
MALEIRRSDEPSATKPVTSFVASSVVHPMTFIVPEKSATSASVTPSASVKLMDPEQWDQLRQRVGAKLADWKGSLREPVKVIDQDHIQIKEHLMLPEQPYVVDYKGDVYEFIRKFDGSIVVSELRFEK